MPPESAFTYGLINSGPAHRNIEGHRILERLKACDGARQYGCIVLLVIPAREINDKVTRLDEQSLAVRMGR